LKIVSTRRESDIYTEKIAGGYRGCMGKKKDGKLVRDVETRIWTQDNALTGHEMMLLAAYGAKEQQG
jgi:hypothetical protein